MNEREKRIQWFRESRFGMFIHWGLYAVPARGEWVRYDESVSNEDYQKYFDAFDPTDYDPKVWARAAREAGMKYAVMTAKHHDGFCLFDSALTEYKSTNTKARRDLVREYLDAFRAEGLRVGLYYSLLDWHHPDYPHHGDMFHPMRENPAFADKTHDFERYLDYMHGQVRELCSNYGKLDLMWFDFSYGEMSGEKWRAEELVKMMRSCQPDIVIDNRLDASGAKTGSLTSGHPDPWAGDFASPEQIIPPEGIRDDTGRPVPWEACVTMNRHWGYASGDSMYKSAPMLVRKLVECVSKDGNFLLNVGPDARGNIPPKSLEILSEIGRWMRLNASSVYGCGSSGAPKPEWGRYTRNGSKIYAHIFEPPIGALALTGISKESVKSIRLMYDGSEIKLSTFWNTLPYPGVPFADLEKITGDCALPDPTDTVLEIEIDEKGREK